MSSHKYSLFTEKGYQLTKRYTVPKTYLGPTAAGNKGDAVRGFRVNPGGTGDIKVTLDRSEGVNTIQIFQEDAFGTGSAPTGYQKFFNIAKAGKG